MTQIKNLTPHPINIFSAEAFIGLVQKNPTSFVADGIDETATSLSFESEGEARISVKSENANPINNIPVVKSVYGDLLIFDKEGNSSFFPEPQEGVIYIVSLPFLSGALARGRSVADLVSPYKVVRLASDTSKVLGAIGFAQQ